jgi:2-polyprenyl-3-methyl-5-hydroxy-6-metoxy-1,4-benzoquinol methylase
LLKDFLPIDVEQMRRPMFLQREEEDIQNCVASVNAGNGWKTIGRCPICDGVDRTILLARFGKQLAQCNSCSVGYMTEFPSDTGDVYNDQSFLPSQVEVYLQNAQYRMQRFGMERLAIISHHLPNRPMNGLRILDVGCGTGWFLQLAQQQGADVYGVELSKPLAEHTGQRLQIPVWTVPPDELIGVGQFDVITLFDLIEHVPDPVGLLRAVAHLLSPGGVSLIFTPNLESLGMSVLGPKSSLVRPAEHLFYFTKASFRKAAQAAGLEVISSETRGTDIADIYSYYRDAGKSDTADFLKENGDPLQAIVDMAGWANHMRFVLGHQ